MHRLTKGLPRFFSFFSRRWNNDKRIKTTVYPPYIDEAAEAYEKEDRAAFRDAIRKIRNCNQELIASLHMEYEPAMNLLSLYLYVNRELVHADVRFDIQYLDHVTLVISGLREAYQAVAKQDQSGAVMRNTQAVYAGLTYGKGELTENMADQGANRGFLV